MDLLLVFLAVGGLVVAIVMLVLASRAIRRQGESDARVETLQVMATGSVLFASAAPAASADEPHAHPDLALYEFDSEKGEAAEMTVRARP